MIMKHEWIAWVLLAPLMVAFAFVAFWIYQILYSFAMVLTFLAAIFAGYAYT